MGDPPHQEKYDSTYGLINSMAPISKSVERALVDGSRDALPVPDKPSIAVLAFTNMSGDPEEDFFRMAFRRT